MIIICYKYRGADFLAPYFIFEEYTYKFRISIFPRFQTKHLNLSLPPEKNENLERSRHKPKNGGKAENARFMNFFTKFEIDSIYFLKKFSKSKKPQNKSG